MKKINNFFEYLLVFIIILETSSVFNHLVDINLHLDIVAILLLVILNIFNYKNIKLNKNLAFMNLLYLLILLISQFFLDSQLYTCIVKFCCYYLLTYTYFSSKKSENIKDFCKKYINIIVLLAILSLIFWVFADLLKLINPTGRVSTSWGGKHFIDSYYNVHFDTQKIYLPNLVLIRNTGLFCEAPMFALNIMIAIIFKIYILNDKRISLSFILLCITLISTTSTTGIVLLLLILSHQFITYKSKNKLLMLFKVLLFPVVFIIVIFILDYLFLNKSVTSSYSHRLLDYRIGFNVFMDSPLIGKGINHLKANEKNYLIGYGYSNSVIKVICDGGLYLLLFYLLPFIKKLTKYYKNSNFKMFFVIWICLFFTTIFPYNLIMYTILTIINTYEWSEENEKI